MSAYVVDPNTMHRAVSALIERTRFGGGIEIFAGRLTYLPASATEIGRDLYKLNILAVRGRYPDFGDDLPGSAGAASMDTSYRYFRPLGCGLALNSLTDRIANLKALRCLRYQCSEHPAMEHPLYAELDRACGTVAESIVCQLPQYETAAWGG